MEEQVRELKSVARDAAAPVKPVINLAQDLFSTSARLLDDGVIDPRDTRAVLAQTLAICREAEAREPKKMQFSVARP